MWITALCLLPLCMSTPFDVHQEADANAYSDTFARTKMVGLASAAYLDDPRQCIQNTINGTLYRRLEVVCDPVKLDTCSGYTAVSHTDKAIVLSFRGTIQGIQMILEIEETIFDKQVTFAGGQVCKYFFDGFLAVWNGGMKSDFNTLRKSYPDYQIWVTGHSLGAAMAAVSASYLVSVVGEDGTKLKLMTFGEPRVGDKNYAIQLDNTIPHAFRVTHKNDLIVHVVPQFLDYEHHKSEVWYDNDMSAANYIVCDKNDEDKTCSDSKIDLSMDDHRFYFHPMGAWARDGCLS